MLAKALKTGLPSVAYPDGNRDGGASDLLKKAIPTKPFGEGGIVRRSDLLKNAIPTKPFREGGNFTPFVPNFGREK